MHLDAEDEDEDEFDHFTDAQDAVWGDVLAELETGKKVSHWMWFVFPVLEGVGQSPTALFFSLRDTEEATHYLDHPVLGPRLVQCMGLLARHKSKPAAEILGGTDAYKLHNCATLFAQVADDPSPFRNVLDTFFDGKDAGRTVTLLGAGRTL